MSELCIGNMIPGPRGRDGLDGINGIDGLNAYTVTDASFVMPAVLATVDVTVVENGWAMVGQTVFIEGAGFFTVTAKAGTTTLTLSNSGDTGNAAPTTVIPAASGMSPGGVQGVDGNLSGPAGGDLTGTYPNPTVDLLKITSAKMSVTGVTAGFYGSSTQIPGFGVDVAGRITSVTLFSFSASPTGPAGGDLTGFYPNPTLLVVPAIKGGTGQSVVDIGDILYGSAPNIWSRLPAVAIGNVLRAKGVGVAPAWEPVNLPTDVTDVLNAVNGGTGTSVVATGDLLYGSAPNTWSRLADVVVGNVLQSGGIGVPPFWGPVVTSSTGVAPGSPNQILATNLAATASEWRTIAGTSNQISVAFLAGSVTLSTPQNIHTGASPTFVSATLTGLTQGTPITSVGGGLVQDTTPAGHRLYGWNNTALGMRFITIGSGLNYDPATDILTSTGGGGGGVTFVDTTAPVAGFTITGGPITTSGTFIFTLADDLAALEALATSGVAQRTGTSTWATALGTAGRLVSWSATAPYLVSVANLATYIAGTANQVLITDDGDGTITLSLPQDIGIGSVPTFAGLIALSASLPGVAAGVTSENTNASFQLLNSAVVRRLELVYVGATSTPLYGIPVAGVGINAAASSLTLSTADTARLVISLAGVVTIPGDLQGFTATFTSNVGVVGLLTATGVSASALELPLLTADALLALNASNQAVSVVIGTGLSYNPGTNTLSATGGGGVTSITLTQPAAGFTITGSGVAITTTGTPTFALADDLLAVEGIATTGWVRRTASNTWSTLTTIDVAGGGTGATTFTDAGVLIGNGTGVVQATSAGTAGHILTSNGAGVDPTFQVNAASGAPGGSDTQVQYNSAGSFAGSSGLTWINATFDLKVGTNAFPGRIYIGSHPFAHTDTAYQNTFVGPDAGNFTASGGGNSAFGSSALLAATSGAFNSAFGYLALTSLTSGARNVALGQGAGTGSGNAITTGEYNVLIGNEAQASVAGAINQIVIGSRGTSASPAPGIVSAGDNTCTIGGVNTGGVVLNLNAGQASGTRATVGGMIYNNISATSDVNGAANVETVIGTFDVTGNTLFKNGDRLLIRASGIFADNATTKTLRIIVNGIQLASIFTAKVSAPRDTSWLMFAEIVRITSTSSKWYIWYCGNQTPMVVVSSSSTGYDFANTMTVALWGTAGTGAVANDIVRKTFTLEWQPMTV